MVTATQTAPAETIQPDVSPYLAEAVNRHLADAAEGHCVRVNHLTREQATAVIGRLVPMGDGRATRLTAKVLGDAATDGAPMSIRTDQAIELRNRKEGVFCLFVPAGAHNTTASSLGNSFAEVNGTELMEEALAIVLRRPETPDAVKRAVGSIRGVFAQTSAQGRPTVSDLLTFAVEAAGQLARDEEARVGLGLWRVGLIPDGGDDFEGRLRRNRTVAAALARPAKMTASLGERVDGLKLVQGSAARMKSALAGQRLDSAKGWTKGLAAVDGATFDRWEFVDAPEASDCQVVTLKPFLDDRGALIDANGKGLTQEFAGAPLLAQIGEKRKLTVKWETTPLKTTVTRWRVEIVPADGRDGWDEAAFDLPSTEIKKGAARTGGLNLNLPFVDEEDVPRAPLRVRVRAIAETGEEMVGPDDQVLEALSDEFYLTKELDGPGDGIEPKERGSSAGTVPEGILRVVATKGGALDNVRSPQWHQAGLTTRFTLKVTERDVVSIVQSTALYGLQQRVLSTPGELGAWSLVLDDQEAPAAASFIPSMASGVESDAGKRFLNVRRSFFTKLLNGEEGRNRVEVAEWGTQLTSVARSYAGAWADWLDAASRDELRTALGVDTVRVLIGDARTPLVDALVVLPTHPLRALWFASQSALFGSWATVLEEIEPKLRAAAIDIEMAAGVLPTNVPPLLHHPEVATPYAFFRNLDAGHGVAFSSTTENPAAQFALLGSLLGLTGARGAGDTVQESRAATALQRFHESHPYADPFKIALINPDDGSFIAQALSRWEDTLYQAGQAARASAAGAPADDEEREPLELPGLHVTTYAEDAATSVSSALDQRRREREERVTSVPSDHLRPSLSTVGRSISALRGPGADALAHHHHLTVIQDLTEPRPAALGERSADEGGIGLGLHGLVVRYTSRLERTADEARIWYWVDLDAPVAPHPVERPLSDVMLKGHRAASAAAARSIDPSLPMGQAHRVGLEVRLGSRELDLIRRVHQNTDWVITVDRFIGPELFDLPDEPSADGDVKPNRMYILDAAPDFQDGVSRRSFVTTSSRDEVEAILLRAMGRYGFQQLHESVGALVHTLRTVSGRLVLDALRSDSRAAEVVGIGAVMAWLKAKGQLGDALIVPIDPHLELFQPSTKQAGKTLQRCDLALFRFTSASKIKLTLIEVKSRSSLSGSLDGLTETMTQQMRVTGATVEERCANGDRVDRTLQRSVLAQVLRFYLERAVRFGLLDEGARATFAKRIAGLERAAVEIESDHWGFVIALDPEEASRTIRVDEETRIEVLTVADIARVAGSLPARQAESAEAPDGESTAVDEVDIEIEVEVASDPEAEAQANDEDLPTDDATQDEDPRPAISQDVTLGMVKGEPVVWQPRVAGSPHLFILGIPGQGKTVTMERLLIELAASGTSALVLDFHGTFADPNGRYALVAKPAILDASRGLPFSPFAIDPRSSPMEVAHHAREIMNVVDHVFDLGPIQGDVFYETLRRLYVQRGFGALDADQPDPEPPTLAALGKALQRQEKEAGVKNLVARTRVLFEFDLFKPAPDNPTQFDDLLRRGLVIALNRLGGDEIPLALSGFLLRQIYLAMSKWPIADRVRLVIVLDEAHRLARDVTLPKLMKEGRKYGVAIVIASQGLADFHPDVVGNAGTKISFRINYPDSRKVAQFFRGSAGEEFAKVLEGLGVGHALVQTPDMSRAMRVTMLPPS